MRRACISFVLLVGVLGCGSSGDGGSHTGGVPAGTARKDRSQSDLVSLCKANEVELESLGSCTAVGLEEGTPAACQTAVSACEKSAATQGYSNSVDCDGASTSGLTDCTVTVGEFADCLSELHSYLSSLSCKDAGKPVSPPTCFNSVSTKCSGLFDG